VQDLRCACSYQWNEWAVGWQWVVFAVREGVIHLEIFRSCGFLRSPCVCKSRRWKRTSLPSETEVSFFSHIAEEVCC
jgi:hypothetical protein